MLYDAFKSALYIFPFGNCISECGVLGAISRPRFDHPEPSKANLLVFRALTLATRKPC